MSQPPTPCAERGAWCGPTWGRHPPPGRPIRVDPGGIYSARLAVRQECNYLQALEGVSIPRHPFLPDPRPRATTSARVLARAAAGFCFAARLERPRTSSGDTEAGFSSRPRTCRRAPTAHPQYCSPPHHASAGHLSDAVSIHTWLPSMTNACNCATRGIPPAPSPSKRSPSSGGSGIHVTETVRHRRGLRHTGPSPAAPMTTSRLEPSGRAVLRRTGLGGQERPSPRAGCLDARSSSGGVWDHPGAQAPAGRGDALRPRAPRRGLVPPPTASARPLSRLRRTPRGRGAGSGGQPSARVGGDMTAGPGPRCSSSGWG